MKRIVGGTIAGVLVLVMATVAQSQNLVVNGSFEDPPNAPSGTWTAAGSVPGWDSHHLNCAGADTDIELWGPVDNAIIEARDQLQHLEISAYDPMQADCQTVTTLREGCETTFSFWYTGRPGYDNDFTVELSGAYTLSEPLSAVTYSPPVETGWQQYTKTFIAGPGSLTIGFIRNPPGGVDHGGAHIDDVQLTQRCAHHFTCYKVPYSFVRPPAVVLQDRFGSVAFDLSRAKYLCPPTDKQSEDPDAPSYPEHLTYYDQTKQIGPGIFIPSTLTLVDQFHPGGFTALPLAGSHLLVPTLKSLSAVPTLPTSFATDHFHCYKARFGGIPTFVPGVTLIDQFGHTIAKVLKPRHLCVPVNKNNEDPTAPAHPDLLVCYGLSSPPLSPTILQAFINNQFGPDQLIKIKKRKWLCVPAKEM